MSDNLTPSVKIYLVGLSPKVNDDIFINWLSFDKTGVSLKDVTWKLNNSF